MLDFLTSLNSMSETTDDSKAAYISMLKKNRARKRQQILRVQNLFSQEKLKERPVSIATEEQTVQNFSELSFLKVNKMESALKVKPIPLRRLSTQTQLKKVKTASALMNETRETRAARYVEPQIETTI